MEGCEARGSRRDGLLHHLPRQDVVRRQPAAGPARREGAERPHRSTSASAQGSRQGNPKVAGSAPRTPSVTCCRRRGLRQLLIGEDPRPAIYLDPPYLVKGPACYRVAMSWWDHMRLADALAHRDHWVLSMDDCRRTRDLYRWAFIHPVSAPHSMGRATGPRPKGHELIVLPRSHPHVRMLARLGQPRPVRLKIFSGFPDRPHQYLPSEDREKPQEAAMSRCLMTLQEAADYLRIAPRTLRGMRQRGELSTVGYGRDARASRRRRWILHRVQDSEPRPQRRKRRRRL